MSTTSLPDRTRINTAAGKCTHAGAYSDERREPERRQPGGRGAEAVRLAGALFAATLLLTAVTAADAQAACGDGIVDAGEMCDDSNLADGDCCTSSCQRPNYCDVTDMASIILRDRTDDRDDRLFWKYSRGDTTFENWGDPIFGTGYSLCVWDDDELVIDAKVNDGGLCWPMRPCWKILGRVQPAGYKYFQKISNNDGLQRVTMYSGPPPIKANVSVRALGVDIDPPGPLTFDQYFNQTDAVRVQFVRSDAPFCWESAFTTNKKNKVKLFKACVTPSN